MARTSCAVIVACLLAVVCVAVASCGTSSTCTSACDAAASDVGTTNDGAADAGLPAVSKACAAPVATDAGTIVPESGIVGAPLAETWNGTEAALAYWEGPPTGPVSIKLQRMTQDGARLANVTVASVAGALDLWVASDGDVYIVCWMGGTPSPNVQCSSVSIATGTVTPGFSVPPNALGGSVAHGAGGFVVEYSASPPSLWAQALSKNASANGAPVQLATNGNQYAQIVPTSSGYALTVNAQNVLRLSPQLAQAGSNAFPSNPFSSAIAASGETVAMDWKDLDSGMILGATAASANATPVVFTAGSGMPAGCAGPNIAAGAGSFAVTWHSDQPTMQYRAYDTSGAPLGAALALPPFSTGNACGTHAITAVGNGFLVAEQQSSNAIALVHLGCP